jgi:hypothetical protein
MSSRIAALGNKQDNSEQNKGTTQIAWVLASSSAAATMQIAWGFGGLQRIEWKARFGGLFCVYSLEPFQNL